MHFVTTIARYFSKNEKELTKRTILRKGKILIYYRIKKIKKKDHKI